MIHGLGQEVCVRLSAVDITVSPVRPTLTHGYRGCGNDMDLTGIARFVESLQTRQMLSRLADGRDGLKMLEGILAAYESVWRRALAWLSDLE